jgi:hypothetical protein
MNEYPQLLRLLDPCPFLKRCEDEERVEHIEPRSRCATCIGPSAMGEVTITPVELAASN